MFYLPLGRPSECFCCNNLLHSVLPHLTTDLLRFNRTFFKFRPDLGCGWTFWTNLGMMSRFRSGSVTLIYSFHIVLVETCSKDRNKYSVKINKYIVK